MNAENIVSQKNGKIIYRDGDRAVKTFGEGYSKADVLYEALNHAYIEETGLNVPKLRDVEQVDGRWSIVYDYIPGKTLQQLMDENPEKLDEYLELMVDLQLTILSKWAPMLGSLQDKMDRKINQADIDATTRYDLHTRLASMEMIGNVCHGNFKPDNIVISEDGTPYILDWVHATKGNSAADAARAFLLFNLDGNKKAADRYLKLFCMRSGIPLQNIQKWLPIVACSQSVKARPGERKFLLNWVNVVDYE